MLPCPLSQQRFYFLGKSRSNTPFPMNPLKDWPKARSMVSSIRWFISDHSTTNGTFCKMSCLHCSSLWARCRTQDCRDDAGNLLENLEEEWIKEQLWHEAVGCASHIACGSGGSRCPNATYSQPASAEPCQCTLIPIYVHISPRLEVLSVESFSMLYDIYS